MAAGKTTIGRQLANRLNRPFIDLDQYIERREGMTISAIFSQCGEHGFREVEHRALADVIGNGPAVVATGGGTPIELQNMQMMKASGLVVFLNLPLAALVNRLLADRENRPILAGLDDGEVAHFVAEHLGARKLAYGSAHITFDAARTTDELLKEISDYVR